MYSDSGAVLPSFRRNCLAFFERCKYEWHCNIISVQNTSKWTIVEISIFICLHSSLNYEWPVHTHRHSRPHSGRYVDVVSQHLCLYLCLHFAFSVGKGCYLARGMKRRTHVHVRHICRCTCIGVYLRSTPPLSFFSLSIWPGTFVFVQLLLRFAAFRVHFNHICSHSGFGKTPKRRSGKKV